MLEKTLESPLDSKEIQPVHPKGNQSWIFIGRTDAEAETPILWPPVVKNWLTGKDPDAGNNWRQKKGMTEDEMVGWHHQLDGHELEQAPGVGDGQGSLVCCNSWGCKESDTTERLNWTSVCQVSLSITNWWSLTKLMSIESVMPSNDLILCHPLFLLPPIFPNIRVFSESALCIRWPKCWSSASTAVLPMNTQDWFPLGWTYWISLQSKWFSRVFSNTTIHKHQFFCAQLSL